MSRRERELTQVLLRSARVVRVQGEIDKLTDAASLATINREQHTSTTRNASANSRRLNPPRGARRSDVRYAALPTRQRGAAPRREVPQPRPVSRPRGFRCADLE